MEFLSRLNQLLSTSTSIVKESQEKESNTSEIKHQDEKKSDILSSSNLSNASNATSAVNKRDLMMNVSQRLAKIQSNDESVSKNTSTNPSQQNQVLANFFQTLLAKKGTTG